MKEHHEYTITDKVVKKNCLDFVGISFENWIGLSGYLGLNAEFNETNPNCAYNGYFDPVEKIGTIDIEEEGFVKDFERKLHFRSKKIYNNLLVKADSFENAGPKALISQIDYAQKNGFQTIFVQAFGSAKDGVPDKKWKGYYYWPQFGFIMTNPIALQEFNELMMANPQFKCTTLNELLKTKDGLDFWKKNGFDYFCEFDLTEGSLSHAILNRYKELNKDRLS